MKKRFLFHLAAVCIFGPYLQAATVAEWKFDGKEAGGGQIVPLDLVAEGASKESILMSDASCTSGATGLGDKWQAFLSGGYLDTGARVGAESANACGLVTKNTELPEGKVYPGGDASYKAYMGFQGLGSGSAPGADGSGGTVYLVISPNTGWEGRAGLMGTGHIGGNVALTATKGVLELRVGAIGSAGKPVTSTLTTGWTPGKWYFVAASWAGGQPPLLIVREMDLAGPAASPAAVKGEGADPAEAGLSQPEYDPIAIGALWINTGADTSRYTQDGADARIAYARIDNLYATLEDVEKVFQSLGAN